MLNLVKTIEGSYPIPLSICRIIKNLVDKIIDSELPKIVAWAINGARDCLGNNLALSQDHETQLANWKREANSVASWLSDDTDESGVRDRALDDNISKPIKRSDAFARYKAWCQRSSRSNFSKQKWIAEMERLGHTSVKRTGDYVYPELIPVGILRQRH